MEEMMDGEPTPATPDRRDMTVLVIGEPGAGRIPDDYCALCKRPLRLCRCLRRVPWWLRLLEAVLVVAALVLVTVAVMGLMAWTGH
jgi:hypothetical protein